MRKTFLIILFFQFSNLLDAQCDSITFKKEIDEIFNYCSKKLNSNSLNDEKKYYVNYLNLLKTTEKLIYKYEKCDEKFYYEAVTYLHTYFLAKLMTKSSYEKFQNKSKDWPKQDVYTLFDNSWKINKDSLDWHKTTIIRNYMKSDLFMNQVHFYDNMWSNTIEGSKYYEYYYNHYYFQTDIPSMSYLDKIYYSFNDIETTYLLDKTKRLLFIIIALGCLSIISFAFVYIQLKKNKKQNKLIKEQKSALEHQKQEITDSINYSKRIQTAILPDLNDIKQSLTDFFILYQPKDIVSGDFYYFNKVNDDLFIAAADCTGHGVPGAFMSLVGSKELKIAYTISNSPAQILKHLNNGVKDTLRQNHIDGTKDGMDIALVRINEMTVTYSSANRPLWILKKDSNAIEEIKATKTAIAGFTEDNFEFEEHEINLAKGDTIYLFSDGYADQFGGDKQKKMTTKRFREFILSIKDLPMTKQQNELDGYFKNWQGNTEQVDDLLVIGIRL